MVTEGSSIKGEVKRQLVIIGGTGFVEKIKKSLGPVSREQPRRWQLQSLVSMEEIVSLFESVRGEDWEEFSKRYGDWGKSLINVCQCCRLSRRETPLKTC